MLHLFVFFLLSLSLLSYSCRLAFLIPAGIRKANLFYKHRKMAAHVHAAAQHFTCQYPLISLLAVDFLCATYAQAYVKHSQHKLSDVGSLLRNCIFNQEDPRHNLPLELVRPPESLWSYYRKQRRRRRQKRGSPARIRARLGRNLHNPFFFSQDIFRGFLRPHFQDRTAEEWTGNRGERGGTTRSKGPQVESNLGLLRENTASAHGAPALPTVMKAELTTTSGNSANMSACLLLSC